MFFRGVPGNSDILLNYIFVRSVDFPVDFVGSFANARVDATADAVFDIAMNGTNIGTCQFDDSTGVFQFAMAVEQHFLAGDELSVTAPASADATLADISITLKGTRVN